MKKTYTLTLISILLFTMLFSSCSNKNVNVVFQPAETSDISAVNPSVLEPGETGEASTIIPSETPVITTSNSTDVDIDKLPPLIDQNGYLSSLIDISGNIPPLTDEKWYEWDTLGGYPGNYGGLVGDGNKIVFTMENENPIKDTDTYLSYLGIANPDGSNAKHFNFLFPSSMNLKNNWIYFVSYDYYNMYDYIYKIKTNGTGKKCLYKIKIDKYLSITDLFLVEDKLYYIIRTNSNLDLYSMDINGGNITKIDSIEDEKLLYDNGNLYYRDSYNSLAQYNISSGSKKTIMDLDNNYSYTMIQVKDNNIYYVISKDQDELVRYDINSDSSKVLFKTDFGGINDFTFFNRWLLISTYDLIGYDMVTGKLYLLYKDFNGSKLYVTPSDLYIGLEGPDEPLHLVSFKNDSLSFGNVFNKVDNK